MTPDDERDGEWRMVDSCVVNWILATVSKGIFDIVCRDRHDAFTLWHAVEGLFQDNEMQRAVYLEAELRSTVQGDLSMNDYCTKLKRIADQLRDNRPPRLRAEPSAQPSSRTQPQVPLRQAGDHIKVAAAHLPERSLLPHSGGTQRRSRRHR